ncbi:MAG: pilus assembly protein TadG-related protein [Gaiellaceae bacterium]
MSRASARAGPIGNDLLVAHSLTLEIDGAARIRPEQEEEGDMLARILRGRRSDQGGQAIVLVVVAIVTLLALSAFAVDVGYAYFTHRSLQASADAAALAGAQALPDPSASEALARQYGTTGAGKNHLAGLADVVEQITTKCLTTVPGCSPVNAVVAEETATVPTLFSRVLGIGSFTIKAKATACSPCGVKPLDVMLVVDRTGSMCRAHDGTPDSSCADMSHIKEGLRTFLGFMDPNRQKVGLAVFPPATSVSARCVASVTANYDSKNSPYVVVPLSIDYSTKGVLNSSSQLVSTIDCLKAGGDTAYATAIEKAQAELDAHGRPDVQDVVIFFSDGAANTGPSYYSSSSPYRKQPCHQGVSSAGGVKAKGTIVYSIGYDLDAENGGANQCSIGYGGPPELPAISAYQALSSIASSGSTFYNQPDAGQLNSIYLDIAVNALRGAAGLVDNSTN